MEGATERRVQDGGPARPHAPFERCPRCGEDAVQTSAGFSKREEFAKAAMQGFIAALAEDNKELPARDVAMVSVAMADALLDTLATM